MRLVRLSICWLFICITSWCFGQEKQYHFLHLDIKTGLSHNQISAIYKDKKGFMWFGTLEGIDKYDGYTFKVFRHDANNPSSISDDEINSIQEGPGGKLWINTHAGYNIYDPLTERFERNVLQVQKQMGLPFKSNQFPNLIKNDNNGNFWFLFDNREIYVCDKNGHRTRIISHNNTAQLVNGNITDFEADGNGFEWVAFETGDLQKIDINTGKVVYTSRLLTNQTGNPKHFYKLIADQHDCLWLYEAGGGTGIYYLDPEKNKSQHFDSNSTIVRLSSNVINSIIEDKKGNIWVATDHGGINLIDRSTFKVRYIVNQEDDPMSISENSGVLYVDDQGIVWYGTYKRGIDYYQENIIKFPVYRHYPSVPGSLNYNDINRFAEDDAGNLWIGTNGGGLFYFNRTTGKFKQYKHEANNANSLSNDVVIGLCVDHEKKLWIGTYFGGLDCFDGNRFIHYRHNPKNAATIADDRVWSILEDSSDRLWIGMLQGGLDQFDRGSQRFIHYQPNQPNSVNSALISTIFEDKDHNLWFGGYYGLDVLIKNTGQFVHYVHDPANANSLTVNYITSITQDRRGLMWIGTSNGLNILDTKTNKFYRISKDDGLPDNMMNGILEDNSGNMWVSTSKGLSDIVLKPGKDQPYTYQFHNFDESDGLQGSEFNPNAYFKTRKGELAFGGSAGFNLFDPAKISYTENKPVLAFTDLLMFNKPLLPGEDIDGHVILSKSISATDTISLKYDENAFSIAFADINYLNTGKTVLQYKLDGFDKAWFNDLKARKATYTNLDPGTYTFKVRAINSAGKPFNKPLKLIIKITPPFWKTPLAYTLYLLLIAGAILYARHRGIKKIESKFALEQERQEARRMHEVDTMKINFFTNISHEFRTPLSLILAPVEKMLKTADDRDSQRKLNLVHQNAKRLLNMINQLLDLSKISAHKLDLNLHEGDIIKSIKESCEQFLDLAEKKHIKFKFRYAGDAVVVQFDSEKIERILFNLLSNAIKFTPENGLVEVELALISAKASEMSILEIKVNDSGIGIAEDMQQKIFERFFQTSIPASVINQGSGIGLAIVKDFVDLMGGTITVESTPGKGSCFTVCLPFKVLKPIQKIEVDLGVDGQEVIPLSETIRTKRRDKSILILVVEDNRDFSNYMRDELNQFYTVAEAANGKEGWQKALALHPNLIVSDINMPESNGIDFCKKIRSDKRTEHIPFILVTAFTAEEQELIGLETGANDYLTKPFNFDILHSKIKNLLQHQQSVKQTYQKQVAAKASELEIETPDMKFMRKALEVIEKNMADPAFSVEELSSEMNMSRVTLYKKTFHLTGKAPLDLIKSVRLKRAVQLLKTNQYTISEIAYQVGYNDPRYFTKAFKSEFAVLPSQFNADAESVE